jgi:hypothetical protein
MFRVGQKVQKIRQINPHYFHAAAITMIGDIYTIREIETQSSAWNEGSVGLYFEEIKNALVITRIGPWEPAYDSRNYRPVIERKTDISCLQALLVPGAKIREPA